ncbi:porin [Denitratisoma sp. agr-D3]
MKALKPRLLVGAIAATLGAGAALPAAAETEIEALRRELAEQKALISRILADQKAQKETVQAVQMKAEKAEAAVAAAPASSSAKSLMSAFGPNVTIYGVLDGGIEHISNIRDTTNNTQGGLTRMPSITGSVASRLGVRASKEITPDLKAIATMEAGFNFNDGTLGQGGRLFGRQLFAGVETKYGTFTAGRQYSMLLYGLGDSDLLGPNIYALGSLDAYLPNARFDNSVAWMGKFGKVSLGGLYSTGRDKAGGAPASGTCAGQIAGTSQCRGFSAMAKYDDTSYGVAWAIDRQYGGTGATYSFFNGAAPVNFSGQTDTDTRTAINGYLKFNGGHKIGIGYLGRRVHATGSDVSSDAYYLEGAYQLTSAITIDGGYHTIRNKDQDRNAKLFVIRGFYNFDPSFATYLSLGHISNSSKASYAVSVGAGVAPPAGGSQDATMVGIRYKF